MRILLICLCSLHSIILCAQEYYLFAGTYTNGKSKGIYVFRFNSNTGEAQWVSSTDSCTNPSYLAISPNGKRVYAVNETGGEKPGYASAFNFDAATGQLHLINQQPTGGDHPCFIAIDETGNWVLTGNYTGGSITAFPVEKDGALKPYSQLVQHTGKSVHQTRQDRPHVHATFFSPDYRYVLAPDLGLDKIMVYQFKPQQSQPLETGPMPFATAPAGAGPRHLDFHPNKQYVYVLEEITGSITAYKYLNGHMSTVQQVATHPPSFTGTPGSADIHVSPDGKFLYASNRGEENNIAIFAIDAASGKLTAKGYQSIPGKGPRNFVIDPLGKYLLVANQYTSNIVIYKIDKRTGALQPTLQQLEVPNPVCLKLLPIQL